MPETSHRRPSRFQAGVSGLVVAAAVIVAGGFARPARAADAPVHAWLTTADRAHLLAPDAVTLPPADGGPTLEVHPEQTFQSMVGYGAAVTDSSAWLLRHGMNDAQREALLRELFTREGDGIGFELTRLTIGSSDFSLRPYTLDDLPAGRTDRPLAHFSMAPVREDVIPVMREALALNPRLKAIASPWSAPAWMKTSGRLAGGGLAPGMQDVYARYLWRYVEGMAQAGVPLFALTIQNEPKFEPQDYAGMRLDPAERAAIVGRHLGPLLRAKHSPVQILEWDHNWSEPDQPLAMLADPVARRFVSGVAWHCYGGDPSAQAAVQAAYPALDAWMTECSGGEWKPDWAETLPWMMRMLVIGAPRNGARGVLMWNLALDPAHGPHSGGCKDCRGMVTIDPRDGHVTRNMEYYAFGHASRFVRPGAVRIGSGTGVDGLDSVAFRNPDGSVVLVVCNSAAAARRFTVRGAGAAFAYDLPASGVVTFVW